MQRDFRRVDFRFARPVSALGAPSAGRFPTWQAGHHKLPVQDLSLWPGTCASAAGWLPIQGMRHLLLQCDPVERKRFTAFYAIIPKNQPRLPYDCRGLPPRPASILG